MLCIYDTKLARNLQQEADVSKKPAPKRKPVLLSPYAFRRTPGSFYHLRPLPSPCCIPQLLIIPKRNHVTVPDSDFLVKFPEGRCKCCLTRLHMPAGMFKTLSPFMETIYPFVLSGQIQRRIRYSPVPLHDNMFSFQSSPTRCTVFIVCPTACR